MEKTKKVYPTKISAIVIGPRKSGKRTLINRIFKLFVESKRAAAKPEPEYGYDRLLTDLDKDQGVDPAHVTIYTKRYYISINHLVGHRRFIRSLAKQAPDVAFLVVSAVAEEFEENRKDMIDQLSINSYFGIKSVIVLVTKTDLIQQDPVRFSEIETFIDHEITSKKMKFKFVKYVPVSGTASGLNLASKTHLTEWYTGPAFIDLLDDIPPRINRDEDLPTRFSVEEMYKIEGIGYIGTGRLLTGRLTSGDQIIVSPGQWLTTLKAIENHHDELSVTAGTSIGVYIAHYGKDLRKGHVIGHPYDCPPKSVKDFTVLLYVNKLPNLFVVDQVLEVKCHNALVKCKIAELIGKVDIMYGTTSTLNDQKVESNGYILVKFEVVDPVSLELYADFKDLGKVVIQDGDGLIASAIVISVTNEDKPFQKQPPGK